MCRQSCAPAAEDPVKCGLRVRPHSVLALHCPPPPAPPPSSPSLGPCGKRPQWKVRSLLHCGSLLYRARPPHRAEGCHSLPRVERIVCLPGEAPGALCHPLRLARASTIICPSVALSFTSGEGLVKVLRDHDHKFFYPTQTCCTALVGPPNLPVPSHPLTSLIRDRRQPRGTALWLPGCGLVGL